MNMHSLAKTTPLCRARLVFLVLDQGLSPVEVAPQFSVSVRTVYKWLRRYREQGVRGLDDRSSATLHKPRRLSLELVDEIMRLRWTKLTAAAIACRLGLARSTVGRWLRVLRLSRQRDLEPPAAAERYERERPGDLLHLDVKKLRQFDHTGRHFIDSGGRRQRGARMEYVHVCVDDNARYAYVEILPRENAATSIGFLERALAHLRSLGVECQELLTDNGSAYRSREFASRTRELGLKHRFTKVRRPQTNGKAERFIQTMCQRWAYVQPYDSSTQRNNLLQVWVTYYNHVRPHSSLGYATPASRL